MNNKKNIVKIVPVIILVVIITASLFLIKDKSLDENTSSIKSESNLKSQTNDSKTSNESVNENVPDEDKEYIRLDENEFDNDVDNLRLVSSGLYKLSEMNAKYEIDRDYIPDTKGLDNLNISGSAQFTEDQFPVLAEKLKECANGKDIYVFDLRQESHFFLNGIPASCYKLHNWKNLGKNEEWIASDEKDLEKIMVEENITANQIESDKITDVKEEINVNDYKTEKDIVEAQGIKYVRIACTDHRWPEADKIDAFIDFVKNIDMDNVWLHFHCEGGKGRTVSFMALYDMMKNPDDSLKDITYRQSMLGGNYLLYEGDGTSWKDPYHKEKSDKTKLLYQYVQENYKNNYETSWSEWLESHMN